MTPVKPAIAVVLTCLLLAACAPAAQPTTPATAPITAPVTTTQIVYVPPAALPPEIAGLLQTRFAMPMRVIPADLNPETEFPQIASQFFQVVTAEDSAPMQWFGATLNPDFVFSIEIKLSPSTNDVVTIDFPILLNISETEASPKGLNIISDMGQNFQDNSSTFPKFELHPGQTSLYPNVRDSATLIPYEVPLISLNFETLCVTPGVYRLDFSIPFEFTVENDNEMYLLPYSVMLACPQTATSYMLSNVSTGQLGETRQWEFKDGTYILKP